jgi:hypothetical protein
MRVRARLLVVAAIAMIFGLAGCSMIGGSTPGHPSAGGTHPRPSSSAPSGAVPSGAVPSGALPSGSIPSGPVQTEPPAAATAGGACLLLDFGVINAALGSSFNVAAAADSSETYTCDVQATTATYPDLTLTVTATDLLPLDFTATVAPAGSTPVQKLGKIGYVLRVAATTKLGPAVEVGWLSGNDRLIIMRYTFAKSASTAAATALKTKMITLAHAVDGTTV